MSSSTKLAKKCRGVVLPFGIGARKVAAGRIDAYAWALVVEATGCELGELKVTWGDEGLGVVGDRWYFWPADGSAETETSDPAVALAAAKELAK